MGILFDVYKDDEKIISLTEYSIQKYNLAADFDTNLAPRYKDLTRDIFLIGIINPDTIEERPVQRIDIDGDPIPEEYELREIDSVRLLANWAIIPEYDKPYCDAYVKLTNSKGDIVKEEGYKDLFVVYYFESFNYDSGKGSFTVQLREREPIQIEKEISKEFNEIFEEFAGEFDSKSEFV